MKRFILILFVATSILRVQASHIVGGDMSLHHVSGNNYLLTMHVFRDCTPINTAFFTKPLLDPVLFIGMYDKATNQLVDKFEMFLGEDDTPSFISSKCIKVPNGCTEVGHYNYGSKIPGGLITLDPSVFNSRAGYYFSWERCCRNTEIRNILVGMPPGGNTGEALLMEIPPLTISNSTPYFNKDPLTLLCTFNQFSFNYDVTDADGDSLVYSLITPLKGFTNGLPGSQNAQGQPGWPMFDPGAPLYQNLYPPISWAPGYGLTTNIMDGNPDVKIDAHTGELTVTPYREGIYVVAIKVKEYRKILNSSGQLRDSLLGFVVRELQFTVSSCVNSPAPEFSKDVTNTIYDPNGTFTAYATDSFCLPITISEKQDDSIYFSFSGDIFGPGGKIQPPYAILHKDSGIQTIHQELCWQTTCNDASTDTYYVALTARNNGCPFPQIRTVTTRIILHPPPKPAPPEVFCGDLANQNSYTISWNKTDMNKYFKYYILDRINPDGSQVTLDTITRFTAKNYYIDTTAYNNDKVIYKYLMYGFNICDSTGTVSYAVSTDPNISKFPAIRKILRVTVDNNSYIEVDWEKATEPNFKSYSLYRKRADQNVPFALFATINSRNDTIFHDTTTDVANFSYCYELIAENECGYKSNISNTGCSIVLTGRIQPFENDLTWNSYSQWASGVSQYEILRQEYGQNLQSLDFANPSQENTNTYADDKLNPDVGIYYYQVAAHEAGSESITAASNIIKLVQPPLLYIPNAFTPNGDKLNDVWGMMPLFVQDFHLRVFNRWGELVYTSDDRHQQWDGVFQNDKASDNVFIYEVEYTGWDHSQHYKTGNVTILK